MAKKTTQKTLRLGSHQIVSFSPDEKYNEFKINFNRYFRSKRLEQNRFNKFQWDIEMVSQSTVIFICSKIKQKYELLGKAKL